MRSEREMYDLILEYALRDQRVRGVILNGSRADPVASLDQLRDFDIVYLVTDITPYKEGDISSAFGEILVMQRPDESELFGDHLPEEAAYLMQFRDGNRIDLTVAKKENYRGYCFDDRLSIVLLDKDGFLPELPPPSAVTHSVAKPSQRLFEECRVEFWWTAPYVSKALCRERLLLAQHLLEECSRPMLRLMAAWLIGAEQGFPVFPGKGGDGLAPYLSSSLWERYLETYVPCQTEALRGALFTACGLFSELTSLAAQKLGFSCDGRLDREVPGFLKAVQPAMAALPPSPSWEKEIQRTIETGKQTFHRKGT